MRTDQGFLSVPEAGGPGIVVVHDVWGLYGHFEDLSARLAEEGFTALAVDLYRAYPERPGKDDPGAWMRELSDPDVLSNVERAVAFLHAHPSVGGRGVGVVGFCMGGSYALLAGASVPGVDALASFYGVLSYDTGLYASSVPLDPGKKPLAPLDAASGIRCPLIAFYGAQDPFISVEEIRELERRVGEGASPSEVRLYPDAGHAFMNDTRPAAYRPDAARDAWARMIAFFHRHLDRGPSE